MQATWKRLFHLISVDEENEAEITQILNSFPDKEKLKQIINTPNGDEMQETQIMWACWRLKVQTVKDLLKYGANPHFINEMGEGVSTYWDLEKIRKFPNNKTFEIADLLCSRGVCLDRSSTSSYSLIKRCQKNDLNELAEKICLLAEVKLELQSTGEVEEKYYWFG